MAAYLADSPRGTDAVLAKFHKLSASTMATTMIPMASFNIKIKLVLIVLRDGGAVLFLWEHRHRSVAREQNNEREKSTQLSKSRSGCNKSGKKWCSGNFRKLF